MNRVRLAAVSTGLLLAAALPGQAGVAGVWTRQSPLPTTYHIQGVDMLPVAEGWAVGDGDQSNNHGVIFHSTDGGQAGPSSSPAARSPNSMAWMPSTGRRLWRLAIWA